MCLIINSNVFGDNYLFAKWLVTRVQLLLMRGLMKRSVKHLDDLVALAFGLPNGTIDVRKALLLTIRSLEIVKIDKQYAIQLNKGIRYPGTKITLAAICRTVSYGTISNKGYTLFNDVFTQVADRLNEYYAEYITEYYL